MDVLLDVGIQVHRVHEAVVGKCPRQSRDPTADFVKPLAKIFTPMPGDEDERAF